MTKKVKVYITLGIFIILAISIIIFFELKKEPIENKKEEIPKFNVEETQEINICTKDTCEINHMIYPIIAIDVQNELVQNTIKKINKETLKLYQETLASTTDTEKCLNIKDTYKHSIVYFTDYDLYTNDKYISIKIKREKKDLCSLETMDLEPEVYLIDREQNKEIAAVEFMDANKIINEEIKLAIQKNINAYNQYLNTNFTIENAYQEDLKNIKVYFSSLGEIQILYKQKEDQKYYVATLDRN